MFLRVILMIPIYRVTRTYDDCVSNVMDTVKLLITLGLVEPTRSLEFWDSNSTLSWKHNMALNNIEAILIVFNAKHHPYVLPTKGCHLCQISMPPGYVGKVYKMNSQAEAIPLWLTRPFA